MNQDVIRHVLEAAPLPQILISTRERITFANGHARALLGDGVISRHYVSALRQPALLDAIERVRSGQADRAEAPYLASQAGRDATFTATAAVLGLAEGRSVLVTFVDVSQLQEAGQIRRDFVANVSHELRTPLTALMGFIETLQGPARDDPAVQARFLTLMAHEASRMNRLVRDLLSLSRVESEERLRPRTGADLTRVAQMAIASLEGQAEAAEVTVTLRTPDDLPQIPGDTHQLEQVLTNLVENAIKYGGQGGTVTVTLTTEANHPATRGPAVIATVEDTGEGIEAIHLPRLTERFYRIDTHRSRTQGGTGLGLAIVKHIVSRHRGRLRISSQPGQGSRFTVILPAAWPEPPEAPGGPS